MPRKAATSSAAFISGDPSRPMQNERRMSVCLAFANSRHAIAAMREESRPPDNKRPNGTSDSLNN